MLYNRQPPCEAVSWNASCFCNSADAWSQPPCEAVSWNDLEWVVPWWESSSASLWGCELKFDGSLDSALATLVSLLVRLWVEMSMLIIYWLKLTSASLWGCELKFLRKKGGLQAEWSASLWGCELKSSQNTAKSQEFGQPPCEAVSWNCWYIYQATPDIPSASLWGCELK